MSKAYLRQVQEALTAPPTAAELRDMRLRPHVSALLRGLDQLHRSEPGAAGATTRKAIGLVMRKHASALRMELAALERDENEGERE